MLPTLECDMMVYFDDERHKASRASFDYAIRPFQDLSRLSARALKTLITQYADELITFLSDGGGQVGSADLYGQYARPLPLMVANHLLGFTTAKNGDVVADVWAVLDSGPDAPAAIGRVMAGLRELVQEKRALPAEDIPSHMIAANPSVDDEELAWQLFLVLNTTADMVGALLCNTVVEVLTGQSGARDSLSTGLLAETVNRAAMANPPMHNLTFRFPVAPTQLGSFLIATGDPVMVSPAAAHTDPHFAEGIARDPAVSSRAHLAWGAGPHQCPSRDLASNIVAIGVQRLFERFHDLRLEVPVHELPWRSSPLVSGLRSLPVQYVLSDTWRAPAQPTPRTTSPAPAPAAAPPRSALWRLLGGLRRRP
jgi:cytochrome P450